VNDSPNKVREQDTHLSSRYVAHAEVTDQSLTLEVRQHIYLLCDRAFFRAMGRAHRAVIDDIERVQVQIAEVVVNPCDQVLRRTGRLPRSISWARAPSLVTITKPAGYGWSALRMIWLVMCGP